MPKKYCTFLRKKNVLKGQNSILENTVPFCAKTFENTVPFRAKILYLFAQNTVPFCAKTLCKSLSVSVLQSYFPPIIILIKDLIIFNYNKQNPKNVGFLGLFC